MAGIKTPMWTSPAEKLAFDRGQVVRFEREVADAIARGDDPRAVRVDRLLLRHYAEQVAMADPCKAGLWDIDPKATCPVCGAPPDTDCHAKEVEPA